MGSTVYIVILALVAALAVAAFFGTAAGILHWINGAPWPRVVCAGAGAGLATLGGVGTVGL